MGHAKSQKMKKLAVLMPSYNAAPYLEESIGALLEQTFADFDLYVLDDCSTDLTREIVERYDAPRVHYRKNARNSGIAVTLNRAIDELHHQYEFLARMDADDWCFPERFEKQLRFLEANVAVNMLGTQGYWVKNLKENVSDGWTYPTSNACIRYHLLFTACFGHSSVMFRSSLFSEAAMRYDERVNTAEDWDFWIRISQHSSMANLPDFLMKYRIVPNSNHRAAEKLQLHFRERSQVIARHWMHFGIEVTADEVFAFYYDESKISAAACKEMLKTWAGRFNLLFESAQKDMTKAERDWFAYSLTRKILAFWKRTPKNRRNPTIWLLVLKELKLLNTFKRIKTLIR